MDDRLIPVERRREVVTVMAERDEALAFEAQQGNKAAFTALVDRHKERVYRTLYQVVGDEQDAQDLAQEVFFKLFRFLAGYRGDAAFSTWLHRITLNLAFDWLRARKRRPLQVPLMPPTDLPESLRSEPPSPDEGPEERALRRERYQQLQNAIRSLPPDYREVVLLYHIHHMSYQQISDRTGAPLRTVETRLYRARTMLRKTLAEAERGAGDAMQRGLHESESVSRSGVTR